MSVESLSDHVERVLGVNGITWANISRVPVGAMKRFRLDGPKDRYRTALYVCAWLLTAIGTVAAVSIAVVSYQTLQHPIATSIEGTIMLESPTEHLGTPARVGSGPHAAPSYRYTPSSPAHVASSMGYTTPGSPSLVAYEGSGATSSILGTAASSNAQQSSSNGFSHLNGTLSANQTNKATPNDRSNPIGESYPYPLLPDSVARRTDHTRPIMAHAQGMIERSVPEERSHPTMVLVTTTCSLTFFAWCGALYGNYSKGKAPLVAQWPIILILWSMTIMAFVIAIPVCSIFATCTYAVHAAAAKLRVE